MRRKFLIVGLVLLAVSTLGIANIALAQPTVDKPLSDDPLGIQYAVDWITQAFSAGWYVGIAVALFLFVNILRGKMKVKGVVFKIPWLSDRFDKLSKVWKLVIISGGVTVGMGFYGLAKVIDWEFGEIMKCFFSGAAGGLMLALMANGLNDAKRAVDSRKIPKGE